MPNVHLIADGGVSFGKEVLERTVARDLHEADHRRGRERAFPADMPRYEVAVDYPLQAALDSRLNAIYGRHALDCLQ